MSLNYLKIFALICVYLLANQSIKSQISYFDLGAGLGIANYSGDMSSDNVGQVLGTSQFSALLYGRYNFTPYLSTKMGITYAKLSADDSNANSVSIQNRNLSFFTNLFEISLTGEINVLKYDPLDGRSIFTVYGMAGIAGFYFNPKAELDGQVYELQRLGTEGQGLSEYPDRDFYSLYQMSIPFGGGLKVKINESLNFNMEMSWRFTFTDYIDDVSTTYPDYVSILNERGDIAAELSHRYENEDPGSRSDSQRGNPDIKDYYFTLHIGVSYNLVDFSSYNGYKRLRRKSKTSKCPTF